MSDLAPNPAIRVAGPGTLAASLEAALSETAAIAVLVNADDPADPALIIQRCHEFAATSPGEALIVTILHEAPPGLATFDTHAAHATLSTFTRQAALDWAPSRIRLNAILLAPTLPRGTATLDDIARTIRAMAAWPSMTGQIISLGAP